MSTWILLRGLTRETGHWGAFPSQLQEALPEARILALDLPGNGIFNQQASPTHLRDMVDQARSQLVVRGLPPPYHLLAVSLGAMVAVAWAERHPQEIAGCVLINTSLRGISPLQRRLRPRTWPTLFRLVLTPSAEGRERLIYRLTSRTQPGETTVWRDWAHIRRNRPVSLRNTLRQLLAAARFSAPARAPVPVLVLASTQDGLVASECSQELARCWGCPIALHPQAGHDLPLDDGPWVAGTIRQWLARPIAEPVPDP